jgi:tetratricopeptide (TPR) repeat protein
MHKDDYVAALADFDQALALKSNDLSFSEDRREALVKLQRYEDAIQECDRFIQLLPDDVKLIGKRGITLNELDEAKNTPDLFDKLILVAQQHIVLEEKGDLLHNRQSLLEQALIAFDGALEIFADCPNCLSQRSKVNMRLGHLEEALTDLDYIIHLDKNHHKAYEIRGNVLTQMGRYEEALDSLVEAKRLDSTCLSTLVSLSEIYLDLNRLNEALAEIEEAFQLGPNEAAVYNQRGKYLHILERYQESIDSYEQAIFLESTNPYYHFNLATVLIDIQEFERARDELAVRINLSPNNAFGAHIQLGLIAYFQGDTTESFREFRQALDLWGASSEENIMSKFDLYRYKAIALLCIGEEDSALSTLYESLNNRHPIETFKEKDYALLIKSINQPKGLGEFLKMARRSQ